MYVHQFTKVHYSIPHFHLDFLQFYVGEIIISTNTQQIINKVDDQLSTDLQSFLVTILFSETDQLGLSTRKCTDEIICVFFPIKHQTEVPLFSHLIH